MNLLPFDHILTVGTAALAFVLGLLIWWRNKWSLGTLVYGLMAFTLAFWTSADWFLHLQRLALPFQVEFWKVLFYLTISLGPWFAMRASSIIANRPTSKSWMFSFVSFLLFALLGGGFAVREWFGMTDLASTLLQAASFLGVCAYALVAVLASVELYPLLWAGAHDRLHRRAAYGLLILVPYILAGVLQFVVGPIPVGFLMPFVTVVFVFSSLFAFVRTSLFDVDVTSLEVFFLPLTAFAVVVVLRSQSLPEILTSVAGACLVGAFGYYAIHMVRGEQLKRKLLEEANKRLHTLELAKNDFVDMVAHQLRGPLGGIRASSAMLADGDYGALPPKAVQATRLIQDSATRLLSLADTFLNASRLDVGVYQSVKTKVDVCRELRDMAAEMKLFAETKHLALNVECDERIPLEVMLDLNALQNAVFNLVDNAIKYTEAGEVTIRADYAEAQKKITISVHDTGRGMTAEECHQLFQKFHRGHAGREHDLDGTGLGLYVVRRLVEAAHGSVSCVSEGVGKGSRFTVVLPVELPTKPSV